MGFSLYILIVLELTHLSLVRDLLCILLRLCVCLRIVLPVVCSVLSLTSNPYFRWKCVESLLLAFLWPWGRSGVRVALRLIRPRWFMPSLGDFALFFFFFFCVQLGADTLSLPSL